MATAWAHVPPAGRGAELAAQAQGNSHATIIEALLAHTDTRALETHLAGLQLWAHLDVLLGFLPMERTQHHLAEPAHAPHLPGAQARFLAHERHERAAPHASRTAKPRARC